MKVMVKIKNEPFARVYDNVKEVKTVKGAKIIIHDFEEFKEKEECFINELIESMEML